MNWLQKIAQQWIDSHPDYDVANHLHAAFSAVLPATDGKSWEESPDVFYIPSITYRFDQGEGGVGSYSNFNFAGLFFMHKGRIYRLDVLITTGEDYIAYMKENGFRGTLFRERDRDLGMIKKELGSIEANNPKDFINQVISMIEADRFENDDDDDDDLFPQWPYPEGEYTDEPEEEFSNIVSPRVRGYAG